MLSYCICLPAFFFPYCCAQFNFACCSAGDEAADGTESSWSMDCSTVVRVKTLHISSPILAAKSPFFYKVNPPPPPSCVVVLKDNYIISTIALHFFSIKYMDVNFFHLSTLTFLKLPIK
jgi:hypothetical protein